MAPSGDVISVSESYKRMSSPMRPTKMKAMVAPEALRLADPRAPDRIHEILIRVEAARRNRGDVVQRQGHDPPPGRRELHTRIGSCGEAVAGGSKVSRFGLGDKVTSRRLIACAACLRLLFARQVLGECHGV